MTEKIVVHDLEKELPPSEVLKGINLTVNEGEVVCVIGPSGGGKSTFLRCLNRLEEPTGGQIFVDGYEITDPKINLNKVRQNIGMVFQSFKPLRPPVGEEKHHAGPCGPEADEQGRSREKSHGAFGPRGPFRQGRRFPPPALRRPAAARGHRPRPGHEPRHHALRRATSALDPEWWARCSPL